LTTLIFSPTIQAAIRTSEKLLKSLDISFLGLAKLQETAREE